MSIQANINQLLGMAAVYGRFSPGYEKRQEISAAKKAVKSAEKLTEASSKGISAADFESNFKPITAGAHVWKEAKEGEMSARKRLYEANPSKKNLQKYRQSRVIALGEPEDLIVAQTERAKAEREARQQVEQERLRKTREALLANSLNQLSITRRKIDLSNIENKPETADVAYPTKKAAKSAKKLTETSSEGVTTPATTTPANNAASSTATDPQQVDPLFM